MLHTSQNGRKTSIYCLEDSHLFNIIRRPLKKYLAAKQVDRTLLKYLVGSSEEVEEVTIEEFNSYLLHNCFYIIEALKRDSLRDSVLELLAKFNPMFAEKAKFEVPNKDFATLLEMDNKDYASLEEALEDADEEGFIQDEESLKYFH